jgi:hypothetical protein
MLSNNNQVRIPGPTACNQHHFPCTHQLCSFLYLVRFIADCVVGIMISNQVPKSKSLVFNLLCACQNEHPSPVGKGFPIIVYGKEYTK